MILLKGKKKIKKVKVPFISVSSNVKILITFQQLFISENLWLYFNNYSLSNIISIFTFTYFNILY